MSGSISAINSKIASPISTPATQQPKPAQPAPAKEATKNAPPSTIVTLGQANPSANLGLYTKSGGVDKGATSALTSIAATATTPNHVAAQPAPVAATPAPQPAPTHEAKTSTATSAAPSTLTLKTAAAPSPTPAPAATPSSNSESPNKAVTRVG